MENGPVFANILCMSEDNEYYPFYIQITLQSHSDGHMGQKVWQICAAFG